MSVLKVTRVDDEVTEVNHVDGYETYFEKVDKQKLKDKIHRYVDGERKSLFSDHDPEEAAEIRYIANNSGSLVEINSLGSLVYFLNDRKTRDIYMVVIEDNLF